MPASPGIALDPDTPSDKPDPDEDVPRDRLRLLLKEFSALEDAREPWRVLYPLNEVLLLVTCATIAWGKHHLAVLRRFSPFYHGIPCQRWLRALVNGVDPILFGRCFESWIAALWPDRHDQIAIDGKTARRTHDRRRGLKALHTLSAYATNARLTLAQLSVPEKTNEITAIPELLDLLAETRQLKGGPGHDRCHGLPSGDRRQDRRSRGGLRPHREREPAHPRGRGRGVLRHRPGRRSRHHHDGRERPRPHRDPHVSGVRLRRLAPPGAQLSGDAALQEHQHLDRGEPAHRACRSLHLRHAPLHLLRPARHRALGQGSARSLGGGEHALVVGCGLQ